MLSEAAQEYVSRQTGHSAPGYIVHLFNYCEYRRPDQDGPLEYQCNHSPSAFFWFNFEKVLGLPDRIASDKSPQRAAAVTEFKRLLLRYKRISLCYSLLTVMMVMSRISVVSVIVPLRILQLRLPYSRSESLRSKFVMLRNVFAFSYIITFVTANLLAPVAYCHYRMNFYKDMYDSGDHPADEHSLSPAVAGFNLVVLVLCYIELFPAITYMSRWPDKEKRHIYQDDIDDPESYPMEFYEPGSSRTFESSTSSTLTPSHGVHPKSKFSRQVTSSSLGMSASTCYDTDDEAYLSGDSLDSLDSLSPSSSIVSELPSLQASSYGLESDAVSEVSTAQFGDYNTPSASAAPSIRSLSTQADRLIPQR